MAGSGLIWGKAMEWAAVAKIYRDFAALLAPTILALCFESCMAVQFQFACFGVKKTAIRRFKCGNSRKACVRSAGEIGDTSFNRPRTDKIAKVELKR